MKYWTYYWSSESKQELNNKYFDSLAEAQMFVQTREDYHHGGTVMEYNNDLYNTRNWVLTRDGWELE